MADGTISELPAFAAQWALALQPAQAKAPTWEVETRGLLVVARYLGALMSDLVIAAWKLVVVTLHGRLASLSV